MEDENPSKRRGYESSLPAHVVPAFEALTFAEFAGVELERWDRNLRAGQKKLSTTRNRTF